MRVIRTYYARMLRVNDEYKYASGSVRVIWRDEVPSGHMTSSDVITTSI